MLKNTVRILKKITNSEKRQLACAVFPEYSPETIELSIKGIEHCFTHASSEMYRLSAKQYTAGAAWLLARGFVWVPDVQLN